MPETDYYKILGLSKEASETDIKKAYRKLAMKYHPDKTKGNKALEEKFKKISEAYAVLSDPEKKKQYDTFGSNGFHQRFSQEDIFNNFDFSNIFREFGFGGGGGGFGGGRGGFGNHFGGPGGMGGGGFHQQQPPKGSDLVYELPLTLKEISTGTEKTININHRGSQKSISIKIPAGMIHGKKLRLPGKGEQSQYSGGAPGDLFIKSKIIADPVFTSEEFDLYINRVVKISEAMKGTTIIVPTLEGKELSLKIPAGTQHKTKMRLPGLGLPHMKGNGKGDLFVQISVTIPKTLTPEQSDIVDKLAAAGL